MMDSIVEAPFRLIWLIAVLSMTCNVCTAQSGKCKQQLQSSFLVEQIDLLFPNERPGSHVGAPLSKDQLKKVENEYRSILARLLDAHSQLSQELSAYFEREIPRKISTKLLVTNSELEAGTVGNSEHSEIRVNVDVFRTNFAAAVQSDTIEKEPRDKLLSDLIAFRRNARNLHAGGWLGDWRNLNKEDRLEKCIDLVEKSEAWHSTYVGALSFLFAHEMGHIALGHLSKPAETCYEFQRQELEADEYAGYYSGRVFAHRVTIGQTTFVSTGSVGYTFLERTIPLAGFKVDDAQCEYPERSAREGAVSFGVHEASIVNNRTLGADGDTEPVRRSTYETVLQVAAQYVDDVELIEHKEHAILVAQDDSLEASTSMAVFASFLKPEEWGAYFVRGCALSLLRKSDEARIYFQKSLQLAPPDRREVINARLKALPH